MRTNLVWKARESSSLENCTVNTTKEGSQIFSEIFGISERKLFHLEYRITTNQHWETTSVEVKWQVDDSIQNLNFQGDGKGQWYEDGKRLTKFDGCIDVDIPLTPFTNTLPINRLKLAPGQETQVKVIYLDLLVDEIKPLQQKYKKLSDTEYKYENVPNDFEAIIRSDELGFVVDYPILFERICRNDIIVSFVSFFVAFVNLLIV